MSEQNTTIFGIDLGTTYSCISYVDEYGKAVVVTNNEHELTTPSVVFFDNESRVVGKEAKNNAMLNPEYVVEMVKRHMGEPNWRFSYDGTDYSAEEISSYILRKLADDTEQKLDIPVKEVVITCPAYFGIAQREATARAGEIAGFRVREIINEPTAAAIMYGMQNEKDQTVLVYDLGGGTFDITIIEIKGGAVTVIATGGDHHLGGRNWDEAVVVYLAEEWKNKTGSMDDPVDSADTQQDLWLKAEQAKQALTPRTETKIVVSHAGQNEKVVLTRDKFNELTAGLLNRTVTLTKDTIEEAKGRGISHIDQLLLVGGSTKMPQVVERLSQEFGIPHKVFEPDEAVAKGAAIYGHKLLLDEKIRIEIADRTGKKADDIDLLTAPATVMQRAQEEVARDMGLKIGAVKKFSELSFTNVASHSFGIVATVDHGTARSREVISNLVRVNDPLPASPTQNFGTLDDNQETVELRILENSVGLEIVEDVTMGEEIGNAVLKMPPYMPANSPIAVTFELNTQGRLHVTAREPRSNTIIDVTIETSHGISDQELKEAKVRSTKVAIS